MTRVRFSGDIFAGFVQQGVLSDNGLSRGVHRSAKSSFGVVEQVSGVSDEMVMSMNKTYLNVYEELLVQSLLGYLHDTTGVVALRLQAWWHLVKAWAVLRHDDHGGLRPTDVRFDDEGMYSRLHRSKAVRTRGGSRPASTRS